MCEQTLYPTYSWSHLYIRWTYDSLVGIWPNHNHQWKLGTLRPLSFNNSGCQLQLFFNNGGCQPLTFRMGAHGWWSSSCSCCICQRTVPSINGCCTLMATNPTSMQILKCPNCYLREWLIGWSTRIGNEISSFIQTVVEDEFNLDIPVFFCWNGLRNFVPIL